MDLYPEQVRLVYHHHPFDSSDSPFSWVIAASLEYAGDKDKFWEMHDRVTMNAPQDLDDLKIIIENIGLDVEESIAAIDSEEYYATVFEAREEAKSRGVSGIALFVNSTEYMKYPGTLDDLVNAIDNELERIAENDQS